jgi:hypothetical protein
MMSIRGTLLQSGRAGKVALGSAMLLIAIATISGTEGRQRHGPGARAFQGGVPIQTTEGF